MIFEIIKSNVLNYFPPKQLLEVLKWQVRHYINKTPNEAMYFGGAPPCITVQGLGEYKPRSIYMEGPTPKRKTCNDAFTFTHLYFRLMGWAIPIKEKHQPHSSSTFTFNWDKIQEEARIKIWRHTKATLISHLTIAAFWSWTTRGSLAGWDRQVMAPLIQ